MSPGWVRGQTAVRAIGQSLTVAVGPGMVARCVPGSPGLWLKPSRNTVVDELNNSAEGRRVQVVRVQALGYEHEVAALADRVVTQTRYQHEVLDGLR